MADNILLAEVIKNIGETNQRLIDQLSSLFGKQKPEESVLKSDTRYVYDNIRPSILAEPDADTWVKRDDIKHELDELIQAQGTNAVTALDRINDPATLTKTKVDEYGLTDVQSRWILDYIFCVEGGYFNHPNDPGGETMYGIIKTEARAHGYDGKMKDLPKELATQIYKKKYWKNVGLENIKNFGMAMTIFDFQVNSGTRGAKIAQKTANSIVEHRYVDSALSESLKGVSSLVVDGKLGPKSFEVINKIPPMEFLLCYTLFQEDQYEDLMRANPKLRVFDVGWENRIVKKSIYLGSMVRQGIFPLTVDKK